MPELPEAEAARQRIEAGALNRTITGVSFGEVSHMSLPSADELAGLVGTQFTRTQRHGKYIFAGSKDGPWLHIHLGMAGSLRVMDTGETAPKYVRLSIAFEGGTQLLFRDPRKFGHIQLIENVEAFVDGKGLGPDALKIGDNAFANRVGTTRGAIKSALLSQKKLAGVGNLWADEALYQTGIHPEARACDLPTGKIASLHGTMRDILGAVIDTGAVYSKLPEDWLIHNRKLGAACARCDGGEITVKKVGGRSSYHCPAHQMRND